MTEPTGHGGVLRHIKQSGSCGDGGRGYACRGIWGIWGIVAAQGVQAVMAMARVWGRDSFDLILLMRDFIHAKVAVIRPQEVVWLARCG